MDNKNKSSNIIWHNASIDRLKRENLNKHKGAILWFTGLSGSGKSTLAHTVEEKLYAMGCRTYVLDGDNVRHGLCGDLGFSEADRKENIRRVGNIAKLFLDAGIIVLTAFISPYREDRQIARNLVATGDFHEIFCNSSVDVCESRDVKGLYKKAREGLIEEFTGISSPYETPDKPDMEIATDTLSLEDSANILVNYLANRGVIKV